MTKSRSNKIIKLSKKLNLLIILIVLAFSVLLICFAWRTYNISKPKHLKVAEREYSASFSRENIIRTVNSQGNIYLDVHYNPGTTYGNYRLALGDKGVVVDEEKRVIDIDIVYYNTDALLENSPSIYLSILLMERIRPGEYKMSANISENKKPVSRQSDLVFKETITAKIKF